MNKSITGIICSVFIIFGAVNSAYCISWDSPVLKGLGSLVVPGAGQYMNGDYGWGTVHLTVKLALSYELNSTMEQDDYIKEEDAIDEDNSWQYTNETTETALFLERGVLFTHFYSSFAAYRDARQNDNSAYSTPAPSETFQELAIAPFHPNILSRPGTFIPLLLFAAFMNHTDDIYTIQRSEDISEDEVLGNRVISSGMMDGISEECFFRGFLNNEFSDELGNTWGLVASSSVFALAHGGAGNQATAVEAGLIGGYLGWIQQQNQFRIDQSVALHFWINAISAYHAIKKGGEAELMRMQLRF